RAVFALEELATAHTRCWIHPVLSRWRSTSGPSVCPITRLLAQKVLCGALSQVFEFSVVQEYGDRAEKSMLFHPFLQPRLAIGVNVRSVRLPKPPEAIGDTDRHDSLVDGLS